MTIDELPIETPNTDTRRDAVKKLSAELQKLCNDKIKVFEKEWGVKVRSRFNIDVTDKKGEVAEEFIEKRGLKVAVTDKGELIGIMDIEIAKKKYPNNQVEIMPRRIPEHDVRCNKCYELMHVEAQEYIPKHYNSIWRTCPKCGCVSFDLISTNCGKWNTAKYL